MNDTTLLTYFVQYCPCGHFRKIQEEEKELLERAKMRMEEGYLDALVLSTIHCPECIDMGEENE